MKVMNGLVMTLKEDEIFMCLAVLLCHYVSNFADSWMEVPRYRSWDHFFFVSVCSAAVKCQAKFLPFRINCRLQLAGLGKKKEETVKPTCFSLLYVESDFGTTEPQTNHSQYSSPVEGLNLIVESKSQPADLENSTIGVTCAVEGKKSLQSYCSVDFDFLAFNAIWYDLRCHIAWLLKFR